MSAQYFSDGTCKVGNQKRRLLISHNRLVISFSKNELVHVARKAKELGATSPRDLAHAVKSSFFNIPKDRADEVQEV